MTTLVDGARELGIELTDDQVARLVAHLDLLDDWNTRMNLTAIRDRPAQVTKHVLDSLTMLRGCTGTRIADVGSGAGFPGIPLAIVAPQKHFALVESVGKKCRFLEQVARFARAGQRRGRAVARRDLQARGALRYGAGARRRPGRGPREVRGRPRRGRRPVFRDEGPLPRGRAGPQAQRLEGRGGPQAAGPGTGRGAASRRTGPVARRSEPLTK